MKKKLLYTIAIVISLVLLLSSCNTGSLEETTAVPTIETSVETTQATATATTSESVADITDISVGSDMFTERDSRATYDEASAIKITLNGNTASCISDKVSVSGSTVTLTDEGTYILSGKLTDGMIIVDAQSTDKLQIVFDSVSISSASSAPLYIRQADKVFITIPEGTSNTLSNGGRFTAIDESNIDAVVFSRDDLTLNGAGSLTVSSPAGHGIISKDDLVITGGTYNIDCLSHAFSANNSVRIASGSFNLTAGKNGIDADNDEDTSLGFIYIIGGTFTINSGNDAVNSSAYTTVSDGVFNIECEDDGFHADSALTISGGTVNVTKSYEGLEGQTIDISGGTISITASDDGLNAAGGADQSGFSGRGGDMFSSQEGVYIKISGGTLYVDAQGDGVDSNGDLYVSGGQTYVSGPTNGGNGALDYNGNAEITGGIFVASGSSQMAQNFGVSSTQGSILVSVGAQQGGDIVLSDSSGKTLASCTSEKSFESVLISCPEITVGSTYTLRAGNSQTDITMGSIIYGSSGGMGGGRGMR